MATVLWPWLTGSAADPTVARPAAAILGFAAALMSGTYVTLEPGGRADVSVEPRI